MAFSNDSKYLISVAVQGENVLAVWDIEQGLVIKSALIRQHSVNQIKVDPFIEDTHLQFCTVGSQGSFTFWRLDLAGQQFQNYDVVPPKDFLDSSFTSLEFTNYLPSPVNTYLILLGASDGSMTAYD
jgi:WD40 repeat protein